ncbi:hypothetical protein DCS_03390 [Drechmeria coniospora]|uniref:RING-type domain-containing protein n=1 Tax=Drechmeria coniospora TaxID=98403 RepID=A0A151GH06_DRECN|nr:hypothetical protein DCS_03390 [Drechmeria coniospora]KYK56390.1 hypothetical protein DCS_03390 [Drechmeria coniospora]
MATDQSPEDNLATTGPSWLAGLVIGIMMLMLAALSVSVWYFMRRGEQQQGRREVDVEAAPGPNRVNHLDAVAASQPFKKLRAEMPEDGGCSKGTTCAICIELVEDREMVRRLGCGHVFHSSCIMRWFLKQHDICPLCKACFMVKSESSSTERQ